MFAPGCALHLAKHRSTPLGLALSLSVFLAALAQRTRKPRFCPLVGRRAVHRSKKWSPTSESGQGRRIWLPAVGLACPLFSVSDRFVARRRTPLGDITGCEQSHLVGAGDDPIGTMDAGSQEGAAAERFLWS